MKNWLIAAYKTNELNRVESNLKNQKFNYYLPKVITKKFNSEIKLEVLFPGYIFIHTKFENYSTLKYTKGIKDIIKFGNNVSCMTDDEIKAIQLVEETSKLNPIELNLKIGQDAIIANGSLKGNIVKICSLPSKDRVYILLSILGSIRRVSVLKKDLML